MATDLIQIRDLEFAYPAQFADSTSWKLIIKNLEIPSAAICRVTGGNMVGKTTLLRILAGLESFRPYSNTRLSGELFHPSINTKETVLTLHLKNTFFLSHSDRMFPEMTIWENVKLSRNCGFLPRKDARRRFMEYMSGLRVLRDKSDKTLLGSLSSGGQALIRLARAYVWGAQLVLIDEVTAHLDDDSAAEFFANLRTFLAAGCSVILVSHDSRDHELAAELASEKTHLLTIPIERKEGSSCVIVPSSC